MSSHFERRDPFAAPAELADSHAPFFARHERDGIFFNPWADREPPPMRDLLKWQLSSNPWAEAKRTERPVPPDPTGLEAFRASDAPVRVLWMGHASFLVGLGEHNLLFDPVYGKLAPFVKRIGPEPFPLERLPPIDAVFLSHGHYDHLDAPTLSTVARSNPEVTFLVPRGQEVFLPGEVHDVKTFDWWDRAQLFGHDVTFVPMQHWHRRGLRDYNRGLWGAWFVGDRIFHCGDTGYCDVFSLLGKQFEVETALMPVGAFEPRWFMKAQHMNPEESLQAFKELGAVEFVAMHWGTYDLTDEPLNLGAERISGLASDFGLSPQVHVPPPGRLLEFG